MFTCNFVRQVLINRYTFNESLLLSPTSSYLFRPSSYLLPGRTARPPSHSILSPSHSIPSPSLIHPSFVPPLSLLRPSLSLLRSSFILPLIILRPSPVPSLSFRLLLKLDPEPIPRSLFSLSLISSSFHSVYFSATPLHSAPPSSPSSGPSPTLSLPPPLPSPIPPGLCPCVARSSVGSASTRASLLDANKEQLTGAFDATGVSPSL